jgi:hypothetical protein
MQAALQQAPRLRNVLLEHVRVLGFALRKPAVVAAALIGMATIAVIADMPRQGGAMNFQPERHMLPVLLAVVFPILVWRGEDLFGSAFLWTVPVDRRQHALTRVVAGWMWLMGAVALFVLWLLALTLVSGGSFLAEETIRVLSSVPATGAVVDAGAVQSVRLTAQPLLWLTPFTAATGAYLMGSALALGLRHPLRWIVGLALGFQLFVIAGDAVNTPLPRRLLEALYAGPYGIDTLLSGRTQSAGAWVALSNGELVHVWRDLPHLGQWAAGTLLWIGAGLVLLLLAASRHRELRHA